MRVGVIVRVRDEQGRLLDIAAYDARITERDNPGATRHPMEIMFAPIDYAGPVTIHVEVDA